MDLAYFWPDWQSGQLRFGPQPIVINIANLMVNSTPNTNYLMVVVHQLIKSWKIRVHLIAKQSKNWRFLSLNRSSRWPMKMKANRLCLQFWSYNIWMIYFVSDRKLGWILYAEWDIRFSIFSWYTYAETEWIKQIKYHMEEEFKKI